MNNSIWVIERTIEPHWPQQIGYFTSESKALEYIEEKDEICRCSDESIHYELGCLD